MGVVNRAAAAVWNAWPRKQASDPSPGDDFWYEDVSRPNAAGVAVTPDIALKASALFTCVKFLAETIASMPPDVLRTLAGGGREPAPNHPLHELIHYQPNDTNTAVEFWEMTIMHGALRGTSYAEIVPGPRGPVDQLIPLHTDRVTPQRVRDGTWRFRVTNPHTGETRILLQEELLRIPGMSSDGLNGIRIVDVAAEAIGLGMAADQYAGRMFSNRLNVGGYLVHPSKISAEAQKNLIQRLMERFAGADNAHRPIVLQEGMDFKPATMTGRETQLLEARKWQVLEICRFFRIPPYMVGILDAPKANVEQQALDLVKYTLRPWVRRIEQACRRDLIVAKGIYVVKFNLGDLLRGDAAARAAYFGAALGSGGSPAWMTQNEVRVAEGMNPVDDPRADVLGVGTNPDTSAPMAIADNTAAARAGRLARKEIAAVRKNFMRLTDDANAFRDWVRAFYGGHVSSVMDILDIPKDAARAYCAFQSAAVLRANDVTTLLDRWDDTLAGEIAKTLEKHGDDDDHDAPAS